MSQKNMQRRSFFQYLVGIPAAVAALVAVAEVPVTAKVAAVEPPKPLPVPKLPEPNWPSRPLWLNLGFEWVNEHEVDAGIEYLRAQLIKNWQEEEKIHGEVLTPSQLPTPLGVSTRFMQFGRFQIRVVDAFDIHYGRMITRLDMANFEAIESKTGSALHMMHIPS